MTRPDADRDDLAKWEATALTICMNTIKTSYAARRFDLIAPLDVVGLEAELRQAISNAAFKCCDALDPAAPSDAAGTAADKAWDERKEESYLR